jgi:amino acid adenylation domain-containing protein
MTLIHDYLRASARRDPASTAVVDGERRLSYGELDEDSDRIAARLIELGVSVGDRVGLYLPKSADAVASVYGVMKAGAAYVPIDPSSKEIRASYIAGNCGVEVLISVGRKRSTWPAFAEAGVKHVIAMDGDGGGPLESLEVHPRAWLDEAGPADLPRVIDQDLAYILYTSGSTGMPKGVMLTHRNCLAFVEWAAAEFDVTAADQVSSHAPFHFDLSTFDLYAAAIAGAAVHLVPKAVSVLPVEARKFIESHGITVWYSVPSILTVLVENGGLTVGDLPNLKTILFAGEVFPTKYLSRLMKFLPHVTFANLYGPTETNVCTAYVVPEPPAEDGPTISIGSAIGNVETFVVDGADNVVGEGQEGELLVRGPTVMAGYWGDPEKTSSRRVPSPVPEHLGDYVYRTGDIVSLQPDGNYRFLGRRDDQIKSRGYRIELGEIEAALNAHPAVLEAAAVAVPDEMVTNRILCVVSLKEDVAPQELLSFCGERVPSYMVPESVIVDQVLPKTSTGKLDRQGLGALVSQRLASTSAVIVSSD